MSLADGNTIAQECIISGYGCKSAIISTSKMRGAAKYKIRYTRNYTCP